MMDLPTPDCAVENGQGAMSTLPQATPAAESKERARKREIARLELVLRCIPIPG
jgi:hypothetical protein